MGDDDDPFGSLGLQSVELSDKPLFDSCFAACRTRLSDYTFANTYIWRDSIHLRWKLIRDCLCVFANGDGGLTMLFPPLGPGDSRAAMRECIAICDAYNARANLTRWTRIEYVSQEMIGRLESDFVTQPMSGDYVYSTARMIDLAGGDLASKRQARNRFARRYSVRTEDFHPRHIPACLGLLKTWQDQTIESGGSAASVGVKRAKEVVATMEAMTHADQLGLRGMVLLADDRLIGFTFGEMLDERTCSIVIEKTDREYAGSAQYIFSEFCRQYWAHTEFCNVGDDWDVPSLAWTKQSYRPVGRVDKFVIRPPATAGAAPANVPAAYADRLAHVAV